MSRAHAVLAAALILPCACDAIGPGDGSNVAIRFAAVSSPGAAPAGAVSTAAGEFIVEGSNGTLVLSEVHIIVDEFELERVDDACTAKDDIRSSASSDDDERGDDDEDECEEFTAGPLFVGLDLGGEVPVVAQSVPAGTYTGLEFKVEDLEFDDDDDDHSAAEAQALLQTILGAGFEEWPSKASLAVSGTWTPAGGSPQAFTSFFEAELKIRQRFDPPLTLEGEPSTITVEVDPSLWFRVPNGLVRDLSLLDFDLTGRVFQLDVRLDAGFRGVRHDRD